MSKTNDGRRFYDLFNTKTGRWITSPYLTPTEAVTRSTEYVRFGSPLELRYRGKPVFEVQLTPIDIADILAEPAVVQAMEALREQFQSSGK